MGWKQLFAAFERELAKLRAEFESYKSAHAVDHGVAPGTPIDSNTAQPQEGQEQDGQEQK